MTATTHLADEVSQRLGRFANQRRAEAEPLGPEAVGFVEAATAALAGGKRLRAQFCHSGWSAVANASTNRRADESDGTILDVSTALEVFHAAALVHDDLIDNSDTRRGRPAAHRALESEHRRQGWAGDAAGFGRSAAVLLGDLLVAWSDDLLEEGLAALSAERASAVRSEYAVMRRDVTVGQFLDIAEESAFVTAPDEHHADRALRVASYKSARYSIQQPLTIGAAAAGADAAQRSALRAFGHPLGMAFQLRDDVLGVFGEERVTGKPAGDDLREGKRTVLVAYMRESLSIGARRVVDELVGEPGLDDAQIASLQQTIRDTGALDRVEALIGEFAREADRALTGARLDNAAVSRLRDLARQATVRTA